MHIFGPILSSIAILAAVVATPALALGGSAALPAATAQSMPSGKHLLLVGKSRCFARYLCTKGWIVRHFVCGGKKVSVTKTGRQC